MRGTSAGQESANVQRDLRAALKIGRVLLAIRKTRVTARCRETSEKDFLISVVGVVNKKGESMAKQKEKYVSADRLAQAFRISERAVQRLAIYDGMPRKSRGEYPYFECLSWFVAHLQKKVCPNCDELAHAGPCRGSEIAARADRQRSLHKITALAPLLVGRDAEAIREMLTTAIEEVWSPEGLSNVR
jgi:hypothetical protein